MASKIKSGDTVQVISGRDKGKQGKVLRVYTSDDKVLVEGINRITKHLKPTQQNPKGEKRKQDAPIHISNVMLVDPGTNQPTRIRFEMKDGAKHRVAVKSGHDFGRV